MKKTTQDMNTKKKASNNSLRRGRCWWLRQMALLAAMMMPAVGQAQTDYSGTYYIKSASANKYTPGDYYVCPTEGWIYFVAPNTFTEDDNGQPFLTTYKKDTVGYNARKALWKIEKSGDYYTIKNVFHNKYMVYNSQINTANVGRIRVHLASADVTTPGDSVLFVIGTNTAGNIVFSPKNESTTNFFNVCQGNINDLAGSVLFNGKAKNDGPTSPTNHKKDIHGTIGLYKDKNDVNAPFLLEEYITRPTITYTYNSTTDKYEIDITAVQTGDITIRYTTDGTTPTSSNGTTYDGTPFDPEDGVTIIKAIVIVGGEESNVATFTTPVLIGEDHKYLIQNQNNAWNTDFHFYMVPGDVDNNSVLKVNTTSLFRPSMVWYFLSAGVEDGVQYYYIVNNSNGKYLCVETGTDVQLKDYSADDDNKFKFSIEQSATAGIYNIRAYGLTSGGRFLNKDSGNGSPNAVNLHDKTTADNSRWKFVLPSALDKAAPFTASVPAENSYTYYKIASVGASGYYIAHFPGNDHATASNTESDNMKWYFEVAQAAGAADWLTYYHIRNAVTGDYLYFIWNDNNQGACLETRSTIDPANADRYMFTWAKTADANVNYFILPKTLKDKSQNNFSALERNNTVLQTRATRTGTSYYWTFETTTYTCATPVITWSDVANGYVITSTESDAKYYYTTDGGTPTTSSTLYSTPVQVANLNVESATLRAIAARKGDGGDASAEASVTVSRVATPEFTLTEAGTVELTCATEGVTYYYEMGDSPSDPTTESTRYTGPIAGAAGKVIKAIAVKGGWINSPVATSETIVFTCATPVIRKIDATHFTISCSFPAEVAIRYNMGADPADPTEVSGTVYEGAVTFNEDDLPITVKAIAYAANHNNSTVASKIITADLQLDVDGYYEIANAEDFNKFIMMVNGENANEKYKITEDITVPNNADPITIPFTGELKSVAKTDGTLPVVSGLTHALFDSVDGGKVNGVILDNVVISGGTNVGAICNVATGASRIYNCGVLATGSTVTTNKDGYTEITTCSSTVRGSNCVGGLVGLLDGSSRVINCFSYANITGGSYRGGIVGKNNVAYDPSDYKTMVMNCMFYGDITTTGSPTQIAPIYGGEMITNDGDNNGVNNFNYFRLEASYIQNTAVTKTYNCALGAETRFLQRFEFFRHLLNSNRELAAWWITGNRADTAQVMKWVLEPNQIGSTTPYPILKKWGKYASVVNYTPSDIAYDGTEANRNKGHKLTTMGGSGDKAGTLAVTIRKGSGGAVYGPPVGADITTSPINLPITDKDTAHFNFNYGKVQLPYYNEVGSHNYRKHSNGTSRVVTGWKIVSITGGTEGSYSTGEDVTYDGSGNLTATPYNFADRNCTNKDLYDVSGRVFNQGAYWDVPYGVTAITIEPYWAKCVYLADATADVVYQNNGTTDAMTTAVGVSTVGGGTVFTNGNNYLIAGESQTVFTSMGNAIASSGSALFSGVDANSHTVYDYAVVLVGNYHHNSAIESSNSKPYTVTSVDLDGDNEPDYSYILRFNSRNKVHPVRVDFINIPGLGMAQKSTGGTGSYNFGIMQPKGWFESTNTSLFRVTQFEYDNSERGAAPYILQGGVMEQWVNGQSAGHNNLTNYFHVGGNVWFKEFHRGTHQDAQFDANHSPISVTGGDFDQFHLTGLYRADVTIRDDNAECYITGGRFRVVAGTGMDGIGHPDNHTNGNITWIIDNADIHEFYAGSFNADKPAQGNLHTIVNGGHIDFFCGGPKFGDMNAGRTVTTTATGCTFGTFFGAGYGGNSYSRQAPRNHNNIVNFPHNDKDAGKDDSWNAWLARFYKQSYNDTYGGVSTQFNYQFLPMSGNADNCARIFVEYVKFSMATTRSVTSTLKHCTIENNFYGGGSLGKVTGNVQSTLDSCIVKGNVFGAGFSASLPTVEVDSIGFRTEPYYYEDLGTYRTGVKKGTTTYKWKKKDGDTWINKSDSILYTEENLDALGEVHTATLTLKGNTTVGTLLNNGSLKANTGNVYGGGDESTVSGNTTVILQQGTTVHGNVFGGGDKGPVTGNTSVILKD